MLYSAFKYMYDEAVLLQRLLDLVSRSHNQQKSTLPTPKLHQKLFAVGIIKPSTYDSGNEVILHRRSRAALFQSRCFQPLRLCWDLEDEEDEALEEGDEVVEDVSPSLL